MSSPWKQMPQNIPGDTVQVYVRPALGVVTPYKATWSLAGQAFTNITVWDPVGLVWVDTGLYIPWFAIDKWRPI